MGISVRTHLPLLFLAPKAQNYYDSTHKKLHYAKFGYFLKLLYGSETLHITSHRLGEMFEGDFVDTWANKFLLMLLVTGSAHTRPSARPTINMSGNFSRMCLQSHLQTSSSTPQKSCPKFQNPRRTFENTPLFCPKLA